jgi:hypothetical protein
MIKRITYITLRILLWTFFLGGLGVLWYEDVNILMNFIVTTFGMVGMIWFDMILDDKSE